jgi:AGZA family xanthine/uracil permease-like MFS transporter
MREVLECRFRLREHETTISREIVGGVTTFLTMSYILFVQPSLLSQAGMDFQAVLVATCAASAAATFLMALAANYPVALAPGMGENFFFVYTLCGSYRLTWQQALAAIFTAGAAFMALAAFGLRSKIVNAIPNALKTGIAAGIGLFISLIGMQYGRLVVASPATLLQLGDLRSPVALITVAGLLLTLGLLAFRVRGAILLGILGSTAVAAGFGRVHYSGIVAAPAGLSATLWKMDFGGLFHRDPATVAVVVFVLFFLALFDTVGTLVGVGRQAGLMRNGALPRAERALFSDATGTVVGAALGTSTVTCYIESAAGVSDGARTGLASMTTATLLLISMLFAPLARMIGGGVPVPSAQGGGVAYPTLAPALILVGAMMMRCARDMDWEDPTESVPGFLTMILIPFSFSIAAGVGAGFVLYAAAKLLAGRPKECPAVVYVFAALYVIQYAVARQ